MTVTPTVTAANLYRHTAPRDAQSAAPTVTPTVTPTFPASADVRAIVRLALAEDVGRGDITTEATVAAETTATAEILQKPPGVLCGLPVVERSFTSSTHASRSPVWPRKARWRSRCLLSSNSVAAWWRGSTARPRDPDRRAHGAELRAAPLGRGHRQSPRRRARRRHPSHRARHAQDDARPAGARKVRRPGRRRRNHRAGLDDGFLIKENHIRAAGGITPAVHAAQRRAAPGQLVEIEVTNLDELDEALAAGATLVLLDNFSEPGLRRPSSRPPAGRGWKPAAASPSTTWPPSRPRASTTSLSAR